MLLRDADSFIEILLIERTPATLPGAGDLRFSARVAFGTFRGECDEIWIAAPAFRDFLSGLQALEARRQGSAVLESMSPGELLLEVDSTDRAGHMAASGQLGRWCYAGGEGMSWCQVPFYFSFCPSLLPGILEEFRAMAADV
jgi:hypothetical protein